jgi:hypothetical protein
MRFCSWLDSNRQPKMYQDAMLAIHDTLIQKGLNRGLTHTMELIPSRQSNGETYDFLCDCLRSLTNN